MTENKWLTTANDPHTMAHFVMRLVYPEQSWAAARRRRWPYVTLAPRGLWRARRALRSASGGRPTERKLELFTHACCRLVWHLIPLRAFRRLLERRERRFEDPSGRHAFDPSNPFGGADRRVYRAVLRELRAACGQPSLEFLDACEQACLLARETSERDFRFRRGGGARSGRVLTEEAVLRVRYAAGYEAAAAGHPERHRGWNAGSKRVARSMCGLLREIFGNPFRPVTFDPTWRTTNVQLLARHIYDARDFGAMPILADALQDAGCGDDDILNHCRDTTQVHVRGCWVLDLVLGKR